MTDQDVLKQKLKSCVMLRMAHELGHRIDNKSSNWFIWLGALLKQAGFDTFNWKFRDDYTHRLFMVNQGALMQELGYRVDTESLSRQASAYLLLQERVLSGINRPGLIYSPVSVSEFTELFDQHWADVWEKSMEQGVTQSELEVCQRSLKGLSTRGHRRAILNRAMSEPS